MKAWILGLTALALATGPAAAQGVVNVYNWSDYIDESILEEFTEETGIEVRYDVFDSNELLEAKLLAGSTGYDVVVPSAHFLARQIQAGVFDKLDKSQLPNMENLDPEIMERVGKYDPGAQYAIPYLWGTTGIGYVEEMVLERMPDAPVDSWDLIFKPDIISKFADCGVHVLDAPTELLPIAMNYLGLDPDPKDPADIEKGAELLMEIRPYIQKFHSSEYINALANGDICIAVGWSGDILQARDRAAEAENGITVKYSIPNEGTQMWFDMMAIPADAPNKENAHAFINFLMRPDVIAKATNYVNYANANIASLPMVDDAVKSDPAIYPSEEAKEQLFTVTALPPRAQRVATREWTRIKTGQ